MKVCVTFGTKAYKQHTKHTVKRNTRDKPIKGLCGSNRFINCFLKRVDCVFSDHISRHVDLIKFKKGFQEAELSPLVIY